MHFGVAFDSSLELSHLKSTFILIVEFVRIIWIDLLSFAKIVELFGFGGENVSPKHHLPKPLIIHIYHIYAAYVARLLISLQNQH